MRDGAQYKINKYRSGDGNSCITPEFTARGPIRHVTMKQIFIDNINSV
jgi:hypothetical protein